MASSKQPEPESSDKAVSTPDPATSTKDGPPVKPNYDEFQEALTTATKKMDDAKARVKAQQAKVDASKPGTKDGPADGRLQAIRDEMSKIRQEQAARKGSRANVQERIKAYDTQVKAKDNEIKKIKGSTSYKSAADIEREIKHLEGQVDSGRMKIVDEKKALSEVSNLQKQKKSFTAIDGLQRDIKVLKDKISEEKDQLKDPVAEELQTNYERLMKDQNSIKEERSSGFATLNDARDKLREARDSQTAAFNERKALQDNFYDQDRKYKTFQRQAAMEREARKKAERESFARDKRTELLKQRLEDAALPAYGEELKALGSLMRIINPKGGQNDASSEPRALAAVAQRKVGDTSFEGRRLEKKSEEEAYFVGAGKKKGKKGKRGKDASNESEKDGTSSQLSDDQVFGQLWNPASLEMFAILKIEPPGTKAEVGDIYASLDAKKKFCLDDRNRKTQENIEVARKEFEKQEANSNETSQPDAAGKPSHKSLPVRKPADGDQPASNAAAVKQPSTSAEPKESTQETNGS
ncbi:MAG: hypothetical protein M1831_001122 [Alyxoria varia]|nr:MAG: hypothetical protein M1831_001122 [Alyxoria varia]